MPKRHDNTLLKRLWFLPLGLLIVTILLGVIRPFGWDELEHIHASYLIHTGKVPYRDFFEHHHPLAWYIYSLLFNITPDKTAVLWLIRGLSIILGCLNLWLVYLISHVYIKEKIFRVLAVLFAGTSIVFLSNGMEIRPDTIMMSFVLLSYYLLVKPTDRSMLHSRILSGLLLGVSFLFLQKSILFLPIFNIVILLNWMGFKSTVKEVLAFSTGFVLPVTLFFALIYLGGIWNSYFFLNWTLNSHFDDVFSIQRTFDLFTMKNSLFFIIIAIAIGYFVGNVSRLRNDHSLLSLISTITLFSLTLVTVTRSPYSQYLLPIVFFGGIVIAKFLEDIPVQRRVKTVASMLFLLLSALPLFYYNSYQINDYTLFKELHEIETTAQKPEIEKRALAIQKNLNVFEKEHSYYWFSPEGQETIKRLQKEGKTPFSLPTFTPDPVNQ